VLRRLVVIVCGLVLSRMLTCAIVEAGSPTLTLKWQKAGCVDGEWCETGWYASPAVADLDGNGTQEIVWSAYSIWAVDGASGSVLWKVASGHDRAQPGASNVGRTWPGIVIADVDGNGEPEIVTAHGGGYVSIYDRDGYFYSAQWPQRPAANELRGLATYDLDGDGDLEVAVTVARSQSYNNVWVYEHDGSKYAPGWPQLSSGCCAYGVYNANLALGELDGDGYGELVVPSDVHYICAFDDDATRIAANAVYGNEKWNEVGVWVDLAAELRGWGYCGTEHRPNFAHGPALIVDVNGDGTNEVVAVGNVHDCATSPYTDLYNGPYIFNADRSRFTASGFDWTTVPLDTGAPLTEDYGVIENCQPNPVSADLDGDGNLEILYASYDGKVHCFWLDKTEHGNWPYAVYDPAEGFYRFASEPVVVDIDNDGQAEVIFGSWTQKGSNASGKLHVVDAHGDLVTEIAVPPPRTWGGSTSWNGILGAPTLANIDADADLEVVVGTAFSGLCAYDLSDSAGARVLWATGRGNMQRSGSVLEPPPVTLAASTKVVDAARAGEGETLRYLIALRTAGSGEAIAATLTDTLPVLLSYHHDLWVSSGSANYVAGTVHWSGVVSPTQPVTITYSGAIATLGGVAEVLRNTAVIHSAAGETLTRSAVTVANGVETFLPVILKE